MKFRWFPSPIVASFLTSPSKAIRPRGIVSMADSSSPSSDPSSSSHQSHQQQQHRLNLPTERTACLYGISRSNDGGLIDTDGGTTASSSSLELEYWFSTNLPVPLPKNSNEVLVKVMAAGLNPTDAKRVVGDKLPSSWKTIRSWLDRFYLRNKIPGFDFSGIVVRTGAETDGVGGDNRSFRVGDAVFGMVPPFVGTLTDYLVAPVDQITRKPHSLTWEQAAALPLVGITVLQLLRPLSVKDRSVLVVGASGGTGHVALQVARQLGARRVVAVCGPSNLEFCRQRGATDAVSYEDGPEALLRHLRRCEGACPFDVVLDCVTSNDPRDTGFIHYPTLLQQSLATKTTTMPGTDSDATSPLLAPDYAYRRLGGPSPDWIRAGIEQATGWTGVWRKGRERLFWIRLPRCSEELEVLRAWADDENDDDDDGTRDKTNFGKLQPTVSETFEFTPEGVRSAMDALMSRRVRGKVVVRIGAMPANSSPN